MNILLGYELGTGKAVEIPLMHTAVTGQTQEAGKTTTLEALAVRGDLTCVAFLTKRGEKSFRQEHRIPPYFRQPEITDATPMWKWVASILEATQGEKMGKERAAIIKASHGARTLQEVHENIKKLLHGEKAAATKDVPGKRGSRKSTTEFTWLRKPATGFMGDMCTCLDAYFQIVLPQIEKLRAARSLELRKGINVIDLTAESDEVQMLCVRSVVEEVYRTRHDTIVIIPEAAKLIPLRRNTPVRLAAEMFIRQGLGIGNCLWIDSQDLANVATEILKSVNVWLIGKQAERNEVKRVVDYIPAVPKITPNEIMRLGLGQFFVVFKSQVHKVYVQPEWIKSALHARAIALGEETVESAAKIMREVDKAKRPAGSESDAKSDGSGIHRGSSPPSGPSLRVKRSVASNDSDGNAVDADSFGSVGVGNGIPRDSADAASDDRRDRGNGSNLKNEKDEDPMWKERAEKAEAEVRQLRSEIQSLKLFAPKNVASRLEMADPNLDPHIGAQGAASLHDTFVYVRNRLQAEAPAILQLAAERPELRVMITRPTVELNTSTLRGQIAKLIADDYFAKPTPAKEVFRELVRLGYISPKAVRLGGLVAAETAKLAELGFLTLESEGFQAVAGMKVNLVEA
jgi:hypothetical protein